MSEPFDEKATLLLDVHAPINEEPALLPKKDARWSEKGVLVRRKDVLVPHVSAATPLVGGSSLRKEERALERTRATAAQGAPEKR